MLYRTKFYKKVFKNERVRTHEKIIGRDLPWQIQDRAPDMSNKISMKERHY
jgi:hypothetical protein